MVAALKHRHRLYGFEQAFAAEVGVAAGGADVELQTQFTVRPDTHQLQGIGIEHQPVLTLGFSVVVALELTCALNRPHSSQP